MNWMDEDQPCNVLFYYSMWRNRLGPFLLTLSISCTRTGVTEAREVKLVFSDVCTVTYKLFWRRLVVVVNVCVCVHMCVCVSTSFDWRERRPPLSTCMPCLEKDLCPHYAPTGSFLIKRCHTERWTEGWQNGPHVHYVSGCGADSSNDWRERLRTGEQRGVTRFHTV